MLVNLVWAFSFCCNHTMAVFSFHLVQILILSDAQHRQKKIHRFLQKAMNRFVYIARIILKKIRAKELFKSL